MAANSPDPTGRFQESVSSVGVRVRNLLIVLVAIALSIAVFFGLRAQTHTVSLNTLAETSTPLETALSNRKPTLIEFYANWCTSCQAMAKDIDELEEKYVDQVNFVMLNVDNSKWLPEIFHYRVDGIPHFVFLSSNGEEIASAIGQQPRTVMEDNLLALAANQPLPYLEASGGRISALKTPAKASSDNPRGHGGLSAS
jgi:thiol-disulfide isomerase/thioredoxin